MYKMSQTYEIWTPDDVEFGEASDRGWAIEDEQFDELDDLLDSVEGDAHWVGWSSTVPDGLHSWVTSEPSVEDYVSGSQEMRSLFIKRLDGTPLDDYEIGEISDRLRLEW